MNCDANLDATPLATHATYAIQTTPMIDTALVPLSHGIDLSVRSCGKPGHPVLMFLHGFPEAAFVWDVYLEHFAKPENGGYRCVAPNLRGFERSSSPADASQYRAKHLVQDIAALIDIETQPFALSPSSVRTGLVEAPALACLIAHDWGGAVAWNLVNQLPHLQKKLLIINSPHAGTFVRELQNSPAQWAASLYMNFLARPDAPNLLAEDNFRRLWEFFTKMGATEDKSGKGYGWLTDAVRAQYHAVWSMGLVGGCHYYAASPIKPVPEINDVALPREILTINIPTQIIWGMNDLALRPELLEGLGDYIPNLRIHKIEDATHWVTHEQPELVMRLIGEFLRDEFI
jgi:epoxide hydrolase 4